MVEVSTFKLAEFRLGIVLAVMTNFHHQLKLCLILKFHRDGFNHEELESVNIFGCCLSLVESIGATSLSLHYVHVCVVTPKNELDLKPQNCFFFFDLT